MIPSATIVRLLAKPSLRHQSDSHNLALITELLLLTSADDLYAAFAPTCSWIFLFLSVDVVILYSISVFDPVCFVSDVGWIFKYVSLRVIRNWKAASDFFKLEKLQIVSPALLLMGFKLMTFYNLQWHWFEALLLGWGPAHTLSNRYQLFSEASLPASHNTQFYF